MLTNREINELFEKAVKNSPELAKVFKEHPDRIELYKRKIADVWDEGGGFTEEEVARHCKPCKTCMFAHGKPPFEDLPNKAYCMIYSKDDSNGKPPEVYYDGEECDFYEKG